VFSRYSAKLAKRLEILCARIGCETGNIKEADRKGLRCFVIDGRVVASIERTAALGEFRTNIHLGGTACIVKITAEEKALVLRSAKTLGLKVAGVDIIRSKNDP